MRRLTLASFAAAAMIVIAGCTAGPDATTEPSPSASPSASSSPSPSPEPSVPETPAVAPATGPEFTVQLTSGPMTIRAPEGYSDDAARYPDGGLTALFPDIQNFFEFQVYQDNYFDSADLNVIAADRLESPVTRQPMERLPNVVIDEQPAYQLAGLDPAFDGWRHEFGLRYDGYDIVISMNSLRDIPQAQRDALNASVLASVSLPERTPLVD